MYSPNRPAASSKPATSRRKTAVKASANGRNPVGGRSARRPAAGTTKGGLKFSRAFSNDGKFLLDSSDTLRAELSAISPAFLPAETHAWPADARVFSRTGDSPTAALDRVLEMNGHARS